MLVASPLGGDAFGSEWHLRVAEDHYRRLKTIYRANWNEDKLQCYFAIF
jgi:hypothetical protein